jgi:hypothetical protein
MWNGMTPGCSGGPWEVTSEGEPHYVNGLNSHHYISAKDQVWSPYFGNGILNLYDAIKNL